MTSRTSRYELTNGTQRTIVEFDNRCHCGQRATERGNGVDNICEPCLIAWLAADEPEECPCVIEEED